MSVLRSLSTRVLPHEKHACTLSTPTMSISNIKGDNCPLVTSARYGHLSILDRCPSWKYVRYELAFLMDGHVSIVDRYPSWTTVRCGRVYVVDKCPLWIDDRYIYVSVMDKSTFWRGSRYGWVSIMDTLSWLFSHYSAKSDSLMLSLNRQCRDYWKKYLFNHCLYF